MLQNPKTVKQTQLAHLVLEGKREKENQNPKLVFEQEILYSTT